MTADPTTPDSEQQPGRLEAERLDSRYREEYERRLSTLNQRYRVSEEIETDHILPTTMASLNVGHDLHRPRPQASGWRGKLLLLLRRIAGPFVRAVVQESLANQAEFNAAVTQALNGVSHQLRELALRQRDFNSELALFGQTIVPVIDGKVREAYYTLDSIISRNVKHLIDRGDLVFGILDQRQINFENGMEGIRAGHSEAIDWLRNTQRELAEFTAHLGKLQEELRQGLRLQHRKIDDIRQEIMAPPSDQSPRSSAASADVLHPPLWSPPLLPVSPSSTGPALDPFSYVVFEQENRGDSENLRKHFRFYLPYFRAAGPVLDLGCGRGEFLEVLQSEGIAARGVELNSEMAAIARDRGFDVVHADLFDVLRELPDSELGGIFLAQVIEHLPPGRLAKLWNEAFRVVRPGGVVAAETVNPLSLHAYLHHYLRDPSHVSPVHPETIKFMLIGAGFINVELAWLSPVPPEVALEPLPEPPDHSSLAAAVRHMNEQIKRLNRELFGHQDYAVIGWR